MGFGSIRSGMDSFGMVRTGRDGIARTADGSTEGSPSLLFSREQVWFGEVRQYTLRLGLVRPGEARQGAAGLGNTIPAALHYEHLGSRNVLRL